MGSSHETWEGWHRWMTRRQSTCKHSRRWALMWSTEAMICKPRTHANIDKIVWTFDDRIAIPSILCTMRKTCPTPATKSVTQAHYSSCKVAMSRVSRPRHEHTMPHCNALPTTCPKIPFQMLCWFLWSCDQLNLLYISCFQHFISSCDSFFSEACYFKNP